MRLNRASARAQTTERGAAPPLSAIRGRGPSAANKFLAPPRAASIAIFRFSGRAQIELILTASHTRTELKLKAFKAISPLTKTGEDLVPESANEVETREKGTGCRRYVVVDKGQRRRR